MDDSDKVRVVICGAASSGKTAIIQNILHGSFKNKYQMTMAGEIHIKKFKYRDKEIDLVINDLPGEERFKVARDSAYPGSKGALLLFDLTRLPTFNPILKERLKECWMGANERIPVVVVGNKKDLINFRSIRSSEVREWCDQIPASYFETSAKTGEGIKEAFEKIIDEIYKNK